MDLTNKKFFWYKTRTFKEILDILKRAEERYNKYINISKSIHDEIIEKFYEEGKELFVPFKKDGELYYFTFSKSDLKIDNIKLMGNTQNKLDTNGLTKKEKRRINLNLMIDYEEKLKLGNKYHEIKDFNRKCFLYHSIKQKFHEHVSDELLKNYKNTSSDFLPKILMFNIGEDKFAGIRTNDNTRYGRPQVYDIFEINNYKSLDMSDSTITNEIPKFNEKTFQQFTW